jgi:protein involved in sex pheromone biosynthesis
MKKALTTREKTIQMLLDRWRKKQDCMEVPVPTTMFAQKPRIKIDKARRPN